MPAISAAIITQNEAENIGRAIQSLACADEIVVVDSGSTDGTQQIARDLGARVIEHPWPGFVAQKNFATEQARHDWILSLDADEELNADAQDVVARWKETEPAVAGYRFARRARYLGRWILHSGWYPDYKLRLFDRRRGKWEGKHVHESVVVQGKVETLDGEILHYPFKSLEEHDQHIEFYTGLAAREMVERGQRLNIVQRMLAPSWIFLHSYFFRLGILDGHQGFVIARMAARYVRRKYAKYASLRESSPANQ